MTPGIQAVPRFFPVALPKFIILGLATLGAYQGVWFYQHWKHIQQVGRERIRPGMRFLWPMVFTIPLAYRIGKASGGARRLSIALLAGLAWTLVWLFSRIIPETDAVLLILSDGLVSLAPLAFLQAMANAANETAAPNHERNAQLTRLNWIFIALGVLIWALTIVGLLFPDPGPVR